MSGADGSPGGSEIAELLNLEDVRRTAESRLDPMVLGYYASGADDEITLRDNIEAWRRMRLLPRVLVDASEPRLETTLLGERVASPLGVAPMALQGMACAEGELATVRAAGEHGVPFVLSTMSNTAVEDVVAAASGPVWLQLYVLRDRARTDELVARAREAGCRALVLTVDLPRVGRREADERNRFRIPDHLALPNVPDRGEGMRHGSDASRSALAAHASTSIDPALTWEDVEHFAASCGLPLLLKGILRADDARRAADHGARGVVVSNHGGRQLDTVVASADALAPVVDALEGTGVEVLVDGGVRRGTDVVKALALGARGVLVGRPVLWGLAVAGQAGAAHVLSLLRAELELALTLVGTPAVEDVTRDVIAGPAS